jgi:putative flippase GtrA
MSPPPAQWHFGSCEQDKEITMKNTESKKELLRTLKFVLFSISAGVIQILSCALLNELLGMTYWVAYLIALCLSVLWNFTLNRKFTFQSAANVPVAMLKVALFYLVFTPLSTWWSAALTEPAYGICWNEYVVLIGTMLINFVTEYLYQRFFVFGKSLDTAK